MNPRDRQRVSLILLGAFLAGLAIPLFLTQLENARGALVWKAELQSLKEAGIFLTSRARRDVPDSENVAAAPIFRELFQAAHAPRLPGISLHAKEPQQAPSYGSVLLGRRVSVTDWKAFLNPGASLPSEPLALLQSMRANIDLGREVAEALERPRIAWPLEINRGITTHLPHLEPSVATVRLYTVEAAALNAAGDSQAAMQRFDESLRLAHAMGVPPSSITALSRWSLVQMSTVIAWEGILSGSWSDQELLAIQQKLGRIHPLEECRTALRKEAALLLSWYDVVREYGWGAWMQAQGVEVPERLRLTPADFRPKGWFEMDKARCSGLLREIVFECVLPEQRRVLADRLGKIERSVKQASWKDLIVTPYTRPTLASIWAIPIRAGETQTVLDLARIACALERYRLAMGAYPQTLNRLVPDFIEAVPADVFDGKPLVYQPLGDAYKLYGRGADGRDDGGFASPSRGRGDLVWHAFR